MKKAIILLIFALASISYAETFQFSGKDVTYKLDEEDRNFFNQGYPGQPYRVEISPVKEAADAILKK